MTAWQDVNILTNWVSKLTNYNNSALSLLLRRCRCLRNYRRTRCCYKLKKYIFSWNRWKTKTFECETSAGCSEEFSLKKTNILLKIRKKQKKLEKGRKWLFEQLFLCFTFWRYSTVLTLEASVCSVDLSVVLQRSANRLSCQPGTPTVTWSVVPDVFKVSLHPPVLHFSAWPQMPLLLCYLQLEEEALHNLSLSGNSATQVHPAMHEWH